MTTDIKMFNNCNDAITYGLKMASALDQMVYVFTDGDVYHCFNYENKDSFAAIMREYVEERDYWRSHCITADGIVFSI